MIRSPGASGEVGNPVIGPVLVKNCSAVRCRSKVSCPGVPALACDAATPPAPPASTNPARTPVRTRVRMCIEVHPVRVVFC